MGKALIFGTGDYYQNKKHSICDEIIGYIDNFKSGLFEGMQIYKPQEIKELVYDKIYVMGGEGIFTEMVYQLLEAGAERDKIVIGQNLAPHTVRESLCLADGAEFFINSQRQLCYRKKEIVISFYTYDEYCGIWDIYGENVYDYTACADGQDQIVIDIGMNIGAASIYFASRDDVRKVYAYEPFPDTYHHALDNIKASGLVHEKICAVNAGLSSTSEKQTVHYNASMTCGMTIEESLKKRTVRQYQEWGYYDENKSQTVQIQVLDAAEEIGRIIAGHKNETIILKMDCEGSEYAVLQRLDEYRLINKIAVVMMEWHYYGREKVEAYLKKNGFVFFSFQKNESMGVIYAVNMADKNLKDKGL